MPGVKSIIQIMRTGNEEARSEAAASLYDVEAEQLDCDRDLLPFLNDQSETVRSFVAASLGRLGPRASAAISSLEKMALTDGESEKVRNNAIYSLAMIGKAAVPSLRRIVARDDVALSRRVSCSLGPLGELSVRGKAQVPFVERAFCPPDNWTD
jgi:HEAT repeat protein